MATENRNAVQIADAVKGGEPFEFPGSSSGTMFTMVYDNGQYHVNTKDKLPSGKKIKPLRLGYEKAIVVITNAITFINQAK